MFDYVLPDLVSDVVRDNVYKSQDVYRDLFDRFPADKIALAWTGGKDSTLALWIYLLTVSENSLPMPKVLFIDEGDVFDEIYDVVDRVVDKTGIHVSIRKNDDIISRAGGMLAEVTVAELSSRNRAEIAKLGYTEPVFAFDPESSVGNHLMKTVVLNSFIEEQGIEAVVTALRWDEQTARQAETYFSDRTEPAHTRVHPILHFTERMVWQATREMGIPYCSLYKRGYRSLGTKSGTMTVSDIPAWEQDLENTSEREGRDQGKEAIMAQLRSLGYM